ncbi:MAG: hypothetical protein R3211_07790, partial [Balneolaceae bacterium]|nr:hypothetical protein [Balneolaceae bacterium]
MDATNSNTTCTHCGMAIDSEPVRDEHVEGIFCCPGCMKHHKMEQGDSGSNGTEQGDRANEEIFLKVEGMHCTGCESFLESMA